MSSRESLIYGLCEAYNLHKEEDPDRYDKCTGTLHSREEAMNIIKRKQRSIKRKSTGR